MKMKRFAVYTGPCDVNRVAMFLEGNSVSVCVRGTQDVYFDCDPEVDAQYLLDSIFGRQAGYRARFIRNVEGN